MKSQIYYTQPSVAQLSFGYNGEEFTLNSMSPGNFSNSLYSQLFISSLKSISSANTAVSCGIGLGRLESALITQEYVKKLLAVDISKSFLEGMDSHPNLEKIQGDILNLSDLISPIKGWFICNEVIADLPVKNGKNTGAIQFLHELKKVMLPGSLGVITEYGYPKPPMPLKLRSHTEFSIDTRTLLAEAKKNFSEAQLMPLYEFFGFNDPNIVKKFLGEHPEKYLKMNDQLTLAKVFPELRRPTIFSEKELSEVGVSSNLLNSKKIRLYTYDEIIKYYYPFFALVFKT